MASYQDLDVRMETVERKLNFLMNSMRMTAFVGNGLFKPDGSPDGKQINGSMLDFYYLAQQPGVGSKMIDAPLMVEAEKVANNESVAE